jgi:muconolactone delta-isomerase
MKAKADKERQNTKSKEKEPFLMKGWWNGLGVIVSVIISIVTFFMVYCQTEKLHSETKQMSERINRQAEIQRMKDNVEKYLQYEWFDKAIEESNSLNDTLKSFNQKDSTCFHYLFYMRERQKRDGHEESVKITEEYLKKLK